MSSVLTAYATHGAPGWCNGRAPDGLVATWPGTVMCKADLGGIMACATDNRAW